MVLGCLVVLHAQALLPLLLLPASLMALHDLGFRARVSQEPLLLVHVLARFGDGRSSTDKLALTCSALRVSACRPRSETSELARGQLSTLEPALLFLFDLATALLEMVCVALARFRHPLCLDGSSHRRRKVADLLLDKRYPNVPQHVEWELLHHKEKIARQPLTHHGSAVTADGLRGLLVPRISALAETAKRWARYGRTHASSTFRCGAATSH